MAVRGAPSADGQALDLLAGGDRAQRVAGVVDPCAKIDARLRRRAVDAGEGALGDQSRVPDVGALQVQRDVVGAILGGRHARDGDAIEGQVQPLWNYHQERESLTRESHAGFKERREMLRNQVAGAVPLFGFYRDLLRWLFLSPDEPAPTFEAVEIIVND